jgi:hypothetical protein
VCRSEAPSRRILEICGHYVCEDCNLSPDHRETHDAQAALDAMSDKVINRRQPVCDICQKPDEKTNVRDACGHLVCDSCLDSPEHRAKDIAIRLYKSFGGEWWKFVT